MRFRLLSISKRFFLKKKQFVGIVGVLGLWWTGPPLGRNPQKFLILVGKDEISQ